ncbi:MAG: bacteriohemerythrin [Bryobacteraceae bacterium]|nr:bacteriohemerythrin [Bryobacteraceae bacterium]
MAFVDWKPEYNVGHAEIDEQHKRLVGLINQLHDAMKAGGRHEDLMRIMNELVNYTRYHFTHEENLMRQAGYPDLASHQRAHRAMVEQVEKLKQEAGSSRAGFSIKLMGFLKNWLTDHILGSDMKYAPALKTSKM